MVSPLYWRLSGFYFFYFSALGALIPYWGIYLTSVGFHPEEIGELMALIMVTKVIAPNLWGWLADRNGRRMAIVRLASLLSVLAYAGVFFGSGYWWLALVMSIFSFFWNASLPQFEATTMNYLGEDTHRYSLVRLWGSVGFILTVVGVGPALDYFGAGLLLPVLLFLLAAIWCSAMSVAESPPHRTSHVHGRFVRVLLRPKVLTLIIASFLMQLSHGPYYIFYSIYLQDNGYSGSLTGVLWGLGVIAEVGVFLVMGRLIRRFGSRLLWLASLALAALRWVLIGLFVGDLAVLLFAQILHAATFGVFHAVAIHLVHRYFTGVYQGRGQAVYSSISFGAGGAVGSLVSGYLWSGAGPQATYLLAGAAAATAFVVVWIGLRRSD
jgi:PPP family 3-phenylpropionic acid transporter